MSRISWLPLPPLRRIDLFPTATRVPARTSPPSCAGAERRRGRRLLRRRPRSRCPARRRLHPLGCLWHCRRCDRAARGRRGRVCGHQLAGRAALQRAGAARGSRYAPLLLLGLCARRGPRPRARSRASRVARADREPRHRAGTTDRDIQALSAAGRASGRRRARRLTPTAEPQCGPAGSAAGSASLAASV